MPYLKENQIVVDGNLVTYYSREGSSEKHLLLLHGWGASSALWSNVLNKISSEYPILMIDMPGFGKSPAPKRPYSVSDYMNIVIKILEKQEQKKWILIGHSFGGRIGIKLANEHPELLDKLILVDAAGIKPKSLGISFLKITAKVFRPLSRIKVLEPITKWGHKAIGSEGYLDMPEMKETFKLIVEEDLTPFLEGINTPTFLIWGENDEATPVSDAYLIKEKIRNSELIILKDAGHYSFLDKSEDFNSNLVRFIEK